MYLVDHPIPSEAGVVDYDVDLALSKLCGFLHELVNVRGVEYVSGNRNCLAPSFIDVICYGLSFA